MDTELEKHKNDILHWMYDFIEPDEEDEEDDDDFEPDYTKEKVQECDALLTSFINEVTNSSQSNDLSWASKQVKQLVLNLNQLNETCDHCLIETDQREDICTLIHSTLAKCGHELQEDITEQWREW